MPSIFIDTPGLSSSFNLQGSFYKDTTVLVYFYTSYIKELRTMSLGKFTGSSKKSVHLHNHPNPEKQQAQS